MATARSRLADIEGPGLGKPLGDGEISAAILKLQFELSRFLTAVEADTNQRIAAHEAMADLLVDATARQLREIEEEDDD